MIGYYPNTVGSFDFDFILRKREQMIKPSKITLRRSKKILSTSIFAARHTDIFTRLSDLLACSMADLWSNNIRHTVLWIVLPRAFIQKYQATTTTIYNLIPYELLQPHSQLLPNSLRSESRKFLTSSFYLFCDEKSENIPDTISLILLPFPQKHLKTHAHSKPLPNHCRKCLLISLNITVSSINPRPTTPFFTAITYKS